MATKTRKTWDLVDASGRVQYRMQFTPGAETVGVAPKGALRDYRCIGALDAWLMVEQDIAQGCRITEPSEALLSYLFGNGSMEAAASQ